jgi:hypothetical protein
LLGAGAGGISLVRLSHTDGSSQEGNNKEQEDEESEEGGGEDDNKGAPLTLSYSGKLLRAGHNAPLTSLAFSANGQELAATLASGHLAVYECLR